MTSTTSTRRSPVCRSYRDLAYSGRDGAVVHYEAPSSRDSRVVYTVKLDTATGSTYCQCPAGRKGCSHQAHIGFAEAVRRVRGQIVGYKLDTAGLRALEVEALARLAGGAGSEEDVAALEAIRDERAVRDRRRLARAGRDELAA